ncbi:MAG: cytochrome c biogenesis protein CcdA [Archaeoglobaceae archaeon]
MFEELIAFFLGFISILSPCVLPVLPIVFAGSKLEIKDSLALFAGLILSISLLSLTSVLISGLRLLASILLLFFSAYLLSDRLELEISKRFSKLASISKMKLPPFFIGFLLTFLWLPCITPFLGIAVSEAVLSERPLLVSLFYVLGFSSAILVVLLFGKSLKVSFEKLRKILGFATLISAIYLISIHLG